MTTILLLSFAVFIFAIILFWNIHRQREFKDYIRNIHASIGLPDDTRTDMPRFMDQVRQIKLKGEPVVPLSDSTEILTFLSEQATAFYSLLHATFREEDVLKILDQGLKYEDDLYKTTLHISSDPVDIKYKLHLCKQHGNFIALLCIPQEILRFVTEELKVHHRREQVEIFLSDKINEGDLNFQLPRHFIKGYVNVITGETRVNEQFMKGFEFNEFKRSIQKRLDK